MTVPAARLADVFVEIADTLVAEFDLIEFLQLVTAAHHRDRAVDRSRAAAGRPAGPTAVHGCL